MTTEPPPTEPRLSRWIDRHGRERIIPKPRNPRPSQGGARTMMETLMENVDKTIAAAWAVIATATANGVNLADQFGTPEKLNDFVISTALRGLMDFGGIEFKVAFDMVMGEGSYRALSDAVWEINNA
jgi:hypothetical protein